MTVYVVRDGRLVAKTYNRHDRRSIFPAPMLSRMEPFESPVTGKEISSWRERDRDMAAAGAVDPRDMPAPSRGRAMTQKGEHNGRQPAADGTFKWGEPTTG